MWYFILGSIPKANKKLLNFLYQSNYHRAYGIAYNITMNKVAAAGIAKGAFEKAFHHFDEIKDIQHFIKWVTVATTNLAIDELRKNRRYLLIDELKEDTQSYPDYNPLPMAIKVEQKRDIIKAIHSLKSHYRIVVYLRYYCNLSYGEMAEILQISEGSLRTCSHRALHQIKEILEKDIKVT